MRASRRCSRQHRRGEATRPRTRLACALVALLALAAAGPVRAGAAPLYGVTIDRTSHLQEMLEALAALPRRPTTRVYFDVREPAAHYAPSVARLDGVSSVMGELLDSSDERSITAAAFQERVESYLQTLGSNVAIWEVGNEVNGDWTGEYATVAAKLTEAYRDVSAAGGVTALTLYANDFGPDNCGDGTAELTPVQFTERYVPAEVADGLDYVLLSYYPTQCGGREPSSEELALHLQALHALYPNAQLGIGEVGLPRAARRASAARAKQIMAWAYSLRPGLPYYAGGYFWWYAAEDALHPGARLRAALGEAFEAEAAALEPPVSP